LSKRIVEFLNRIFYKNLTDNWDHKIFRDEILRHIDHDCILLDLGAGSGIFRGINFKGLVKKVYGIDPDPRVLQNPHLDEAFVGNGESMPVFADAQFDVVISCNVLEHLREPIPFFQEVNRVLKPGGLFITKTPNQFHYVPFIARITPDWFHKLFLRIYGITEQDSFPTYYRVNSKQAQIWVARKAGFEVDDIRRYEGRPEYLRSNSILYILGIFYERMVNLLHLDCLKVVMISRFRKSSGGRRF
jgi:SAM-dependent methyltransferase